MKTRRSNQVVYMLLFAGFLISAMILTLMSSWQAIQNLITSPSEKYRQEGDAFRKEGRLPEAVLSYRQSVEFDGANQKAVEDLIKAYSEQGRMRTAAHYQKQLAPVQGASLSQPTTNPFDRETQNPLNLVWSNPIRESVPTGAALAENRLIIAYEDGTVAAVSKENGAILWKVELPFNATSAPAVSHRAVWIGTADGNLYTLSILDGQIDWVYKTNGPIYAAPAVTDAIIYCPSSDGNLYALNPRTGKLLWKFSTQGALHASPAVAGETVFFGSSDGKVYAIDRLNGAPIWSDGILTGGSVESQPVVENGRLVFGSGDGRVYALSPASGGQFWRFAASDAVFSTALIDRENVYISSSGGTLSAVDFNTGQKRWKTDFKSALRSSPVLVDGRLYLVAEADANLYAIDPNNGAILYQIPTGDWLAAGPLTANGIIYLLGKDGLILALSLPR